MEYIIGANFVDHLSFRIYLIFLVPSMSNLSLTG